MKPSMGIKVLLIAILALSGCVSVPVSPSKTIHEVLIKVSPSDVAKVESVETSNGKDVIVKSMQIENPSGQLSSLTSIIGNKAYIRLYSTISTVDASNLWKDLAILKDTTDIRNIEILISSGGGSAFAGMALADLIEGAQIDGFQVIGYASGIVASAAVPILAVCSKRIAASGTIFMVHEAALWKWPGRESASDIRAQNRLMELLQDQYISKLAKYSKLSVEQWIEKEAKTTWFSAETALKWGLVDEVR